MYPSTNEDHWYYDHQSQSQHQQQEHQQDKSTPVNKPPMKLMQQQQQQQQHTTQHPPMKVIPHPPNHLPILATESRFLSPIPNHNSLRPDVLTLHLQVLHADGETHTLINPQTGQVHFRVVKRSLFRRIFDVYGEGVLDVYDSGSWRGQAEAASGSNLNGEFITSVRRMIIPNNQGHQQGEEFILRVKSHGRFVDLIMSSPTTRSECVDIFMVERGTGSGNGSCDGIGSPKSLHSRSSSSDATVAPSSPPVQPIPAHHPSTMQGRRIKIGQVESLANHHSLTLSTLIRIDVLLVVGMFIAVDGWEREQRCLMSKLRKSF